VQAFDSYNGDDFSQACADYDRISPLDPWKTSVLLKAKRHIDAAAGEGDEDGEGGAGHDEDVDIT
jgi:alpha-soluble NSF attachment protein